MEEGEGKTEGYNYISDAIIERVMLRLSVGHIYVGHIYVGHACRSYMCLIGRSYNIYVGQKNPQKYFSFNKFKSAY